MNFQVMTIRYDNTICKSRKTYDLVITSLQNTAKDLFKRLSNNTEKGNKSSSYKELL